MGPSHNLSFLCKQNSVISTCITSLYGSQPSSVVFAWKTATVGPEYKSLWSRITTIYVSQLSSVVFAYPTAHFGPEFQVCTGPRLHLWFWAHITACLTQEYKDYMCSSPRLWFCACKTATLAHELLVSIGPSPHLWFLHAKQRLLVQNNKSLWVPDMSCRFVYVQQRA